MAVTRFNKTDIVTDNIREKILDQSKFFKTSWIELGRSLFTAWQDKMYKSWGYQRFEDYIKKEVGLNKELSMRLLKTYYFIEQEEPQYLKEDFAESRESPTVPSYEAMNVLRLAKQKKEITREDYATLRKSIFDKGTDAAVVRKDLTAMIKERKEVDPDEEREKRSEQSMRKLILSLKLFEKDMYALKLVSDDVREDAKELLDRLEKQLEKQLK
jgi:hypothetical protein